MAYFQVLYLDFGRVIHPGEHKKASKDMKNVMLASSMPMTRVHVETPKKLGPTAVQISVHHRGFFWGECWELGEFPSSQQPQEKWNIEMTTIDISKRKKTHPNLEQKTPLKSILQ